MYGYLFFSSGLALEPKLHFEKSKTPMKFFSFFISILLFTFGFLYASPHLVKIQTESGKMIEVLDNQVLVRYKKGRSWEGKAMIQRSFGVIPTNRLEAIEVEVLPVPQGQTLSSFLNQLKTRPEIEFAEGNGIMRAFTAPNDPDYSTQYYLQPNRLNIESAWDITQGTSSIVIAVCDTGVTLTHPDLSSNLWQNPSPSGNSGLNGTRIKIDFNNDGDCTDSNDELGSDQCESSDPTDNNATTFHGTRVASIIAATTNNSVNMAGIARNCRIMAVKVLNAGDNRTGTATGTYASIAEGIIYAADHGASIINLSLGGPEISDTLTSAVNYALNKKVVVVAAAGNTLSPPCPVNYPAAISKVIAVGAVDENDSLASFSCTGTALDLVAPGTNIRSAGQSGTSASNINGTSFSSPMVAGVAALIRSINADFSVEEVTQYLDFTADDKGTLGFDSSYGFGRLNAYSALLAASNLTPFISNPATPNKSYPTPNPFNPSLGNTMNISIPQSLGSENMEIIIITLAGERIKKLEGTNKWDGKNESGNSVSSGLYFYTVKTSKGTTKGKLTVLK